MVIPYSLIVVTKVAKRLNDLRTVVIILIGGYDKGSLNLYLLVALGTERSSYPELLNIVVFKVSIGSSLSRSFVFVIGVLIRSLPCTGPRKLSNPYGKDLDLYRE